MRFMGRCWHETDQRTDHCRNGSQRRGGYSGGSENFSALGAYGCSVITALVAQNTRGVQSVYRIEPDFVAAQLDSVFSDVRIDTTKIGMLAETDIVEAVAERLRRYQVQNVVLDTVMLAKAATRCFPLGGNGAATTSVAAGVVDYSQSARGRRAAGCPSRPQRTRDA
jgi:hypothetical protein